MDVEMGLDGISFEESAAIPCSTRREMSMLKDTIELEESMKLIISVQEALTGSDATPAFSMAVFQAMFEYLGTALSFTEPRMLEAMKNNQEICDSMNKKFDDMRSTLQDAMLHMKALQESLDEPIRSSKEKNNLKSRFMNFITNDSRH